MTLLPLLSLIIATLLVPGLLGKETDRDKDTVTLVNGDRLSGTITRVEEGRLVLNSTLLGVVRVKWSDVRALNSDSSFSVLLQDGTHYDGNLSKEASEVSIVADGREAVTVESPAVVRIVPGTSGTGFARVLAGVQGAMDIGYSLARGNQNQMQSSLGARAEYTRAQYRVRGRLSSLFARQDGARSQSRHALNARVERTASASLFTYGLASLERNERRRLDLRTRLGGGVGWQVRKSRRTDVAMVGGFAFLREHNRHAANRTTGEAFVGIELDKRLFRSISLSAELTVHPDAFDASNIRAEFDSTLRVPIAGRFTYSLSLFDRFHTKPATMVERNDYGLVSGIGVRF